MFRRTALFVIVLAVLATVTTTASAAMSAPHDGFAGRFDRPQEGFASPETVLRSGPPQSVGLDPEPIDAALSKIDGWTRPDPATGHPLFSGAVGLLAHDGTVVKRATAG